MLKIYEKDVKPAEKKLLQSCNKKQFKSISIKSWGCEFVNLPHEAGFKKIINFSHLPTLIF
jgi:hypothetical protein